MNYLLLIYAPDWTEEAKLDGAEADACGGLVERLAAQGNYRGGGILQPTATATSVRVRDGQRLVTDGPFAETREQLAGFVAFEAANLDEALTIAASHPGAARGTVEVRPLLYVPDLAPAR